MSFCIVFLCTPTTRSCSNTITNMRIHNLRMFCHVIPGDKCNYNCTNSVFIALFCRSCSEWVSFNYFCRKLKWLPSYRHFLSSQSSSRFLYFLNFHNFFLSSRFYFRAKTFLKPSPARSQAVMDFATNKFHFTWAVLVKRFFIYFNLRRVVTNGEMSQCTRDRAAVMAEQ